MFFFVAQLQQLMDLVLTCKRNAENEVKREEGRGGGLKAPGRKRRLEQETAERALKFLKASQEPGGRDKIPGEETRVSQQPEYDITKLTADTAKTVIKFHQGPYAKITSNKTTH